MIPPLTVPTLFVYGTLKRGGRNHAWLAGQPFLGEVLTLPRYRLYDHGAYPCLVEEPQCGLAVRGELYGVDATVLARLDELEEVPILFDRRPLACVEVRGPVIAYFYQRSVKGYPDCGAFWPTPASPSW